MKSMAFGLALVPLMLFAACATSDDEGTNPPEDGGGGNPESAAPEGGDATTDAPASDADALRCSGDFCILDLPNAETYGFTKWMFAGVQADPVIGVWAIANGVFEVDESTAQMLHFENGAWKPIYAPALGSGGGKRSVELSSLASDGAGKLIAVGATIDDGTTVIVRGDGSTFTTTTFDGGPLSSVWFAQAGQAWAVGPNGAIFRSLEDGSWVSESTDNGAYFESVWGSGPSDIYVAGLSTESYYGYLGHRTIDDAGAPNWAFYDFAKLQRRSEFEHIILAGVAPQGGPVFWTAPSVLARTSPDGGADGGEAEWVADPFQPHIPIRGFWANGKNDIWAVGHIGRIFHFDGTAWKDTRLLFNGAPLTSHLMGIAGTSGGEIFVVGQGVALRKEAK